MLVASTARLETDPQGSKQWWPNRPKHSARPFGLPVRARRELWGSDQPCQALSCRKLVGHWSSFNLVSRKLLHCGSHIIQRRRAVAGPYALVRVTCDAVRHAPADACAVGDLLERMTPCVVRRKLGVSDTHTANPTREALPCLHSARFLFSRGFNAISELRGIVE